MSKINSHNMKPSKLDDHLSQKALRSVDLLLWNGLIFVHNNFRISMFRDVRVASEETTSEPVYFYKKAIMKTSKKYSGKITFQLVRHALYFLADYESKSALCKLSLLPLVGHEKDPNILPELFDKLTHTSVLSLQTEPVDFLVVQESILLQMKFGVRLYCLPSKQLNVSRDPIAKFVLPQVDTQDYNLRGWFSHTRDQIMNMVATYKYVLVNTYARVILLSLRNLEILSELQEPKGVLHYQILKSTILRKCHFWMGIHQEALDIFANFKDVLTKVTSKPLGNEFEKSVLLFHLYYNQSSRELIASGDDGFMRQTRLQFSRI